MAFFHLIPLKYSITTSGQGLGFNCTLVCQFWGLSVKNNREREGISLLEGEKK